MILSGSGVLCAGAVFFLFDCLPALGRARPLNNLIEFIYEFSKAKAWVSKEWQEDIDAAARKLFPNVSDALGGEIAGR